MSIRQQNFRSRSNKPTSGESFKSGTNVITFSVESRPFTGNHLAQIKQMVAMANPDAQMLRDDISITFDKEPMSVVARPSSLTTIDLHWFLNSLKGPVIVMLGIIFDQDGPV